MEIIPDKGRQWSGRTGAQNINLPGLKHRAHRRLEVIPIQPLLGLPDFLHVGFQNGIHQVPILQPVPGHLHALHRGEPVENQGLQLLLHTGVAIVTKLHGKAHHRGLRHSHRLAQPGSCEECGLFKGILYVIGNRPLSFGKRRVLLLHLRQNIPCHGSLLLYGLTQLYQLLRSQITPSPQG